MFSSNGASAEKKKLPSSVLLLLWPGEVRRKREDDSGQTGPALFAGTNKTELGKKISADAPYINQKPFELF